MSARDKWLGIALWAELRGNSHMASTAALFANAFASLEEQ